MAAPSKIVKWFFFCDDGTWSPAGQWASARRGCPADRWRLLCWMMLYTFIWSRTEHSWASLLSVLSCVAVLGIVVTVKTSDPKDLRSAFKGFFLLLASAFVLSSLIIMTSRPTYLAYEYLLKKVIIKENEMLHHWCPHSYITMFSVTMITCLIRGLHKKMVYAWLDTRPTYSRRRGVTSTRSYVT